MNLKRLGKNQKRILAEMLNNGYVIRVISNAQAMTNDISIQDEDGMNVYEEISYPFLASLGKRKIFSITNWMPCLYMDVYTYRLKHKAIEPLKKLIND